MWMGNCLLTLHILTLATWRKSNELSTFLMFWICATTVTDSHITHRAAPGLSFPQSCFTGRPKNHVTPEVINYLVILNQQAKALLYYSMPFVYDAWLWLLYFLIQLHLSFIIETTSPVHSLALRRYMTGMSYHLGCLETDSWQWFDHMTFVCISWPNEF